MITSWFFIALIWCLTIYLVTNNRKFSWTNRSPVIRSPDAVMELIAPVKITGDRIFQLYDD